MFFIYVYIDYLVVRSGPCRLSCLFLHKAPGLVSAGSSTSGNILTVACLMCSNVCN